MSEEQKQEGTTEQPPRRRLTQKEVEQLRRKRDLAYKRKLQELRSATGTEERQEIYDKLHRTRNVEQPATFKKKVENYWYHYAFTTIIILGLIAAVTWFVYDMVTNEKYDMDMMVVCAGPYDEDYEALKTHLVSYLDDFDGDGNVDIYLENIELDRTKLDSLDPQVVMAMTTKYTASFSSGSNLIYFVDQQYYDFLKESDLKFVDWSAYSDAPGVQGDRYAIAADADFAEVKSKDDLYLVMRDLDGLPKKDKKNVIDRYQRELEVVKKIIAE